MNNRTSLKTILKLMAKKYPARGKAGWLGAILVLYDDGGGYIRRTGSDNRDYMENTLFSFSTTDELVHHLQTKEK